jgi:hypothetical protein
MDFSVTSGQVPLLYRLHFLLRDLINGDLAPPRETAKTHEEKAGSEATSADAEDVNDDGSSSSIGKYRYLSGVGNPDPEFYYIMGQFNKILYFPFFFIKRLVLVPVDMLGSHFESFPIFVDLFEFKISKNRLSVIVGSQKLDLRHPYFFT